VVYWLQEKQPLFWDPQRDVNTLYPSIYTIWRFPQLIPRVYVWSATAKHLLKGADLFGPGVLKPTAGFGEMQKGQVRSVFVVGNPSAVAIGNMAVDNLHDNREERKGTALYIQHHYSDALWALGDKSVPNDGFRPTKVEPLEEQNQTEEEEGEEQQEGSDSGGIEGEDEEVVEDVEEQEDSKRAANDEDTHSVEIPQEIHHSVCTSEHSIEKFDKIQSNFPDFDFTEEKEAPTQGNSLQVESQTALDPLPSTFSLSREVISHDFIIIAHISSWLFLG
jgi:translation initiation factor 2D